MIRLRFTLLHMLGAIAVAGVLCAIGLRVIQASHQQARLEVKEFPCAPLVMCDDRIMTGPREYVDGVWCIAMTDREMFGENWVGFGATVNSPFGVLVWDRARRRSVFLGILPRDADLKNGVFVQTRFGPRAMGIAWGSEVGTHSAGFLARGADLRIVPQVQVEIVPGNAPGTARVLVHRVELLSALNQINVDVFSLNHTEITCPFSQRVAMTEDPSEISTGDIRLPPGEYYCAVSGSTEDGSMLSLPVCFGVREHNGELHFITYDKRASSKAR